MLVRAAACPPVQAALLGYMHMLRPATSLSCCCACCAGSVATEVQFDVLGVSPVSALSPLAPSVIKLWNSPNPYYMHDFSINGVRLPLECDTSGPRPRRTSPNSCVTFPSPGCASQWASRLVTCQGFKHTTSNECLFFTGHEACIQPTSSELPAVRHASGLQPDVTMTE